MVLPRTRQHTHTHMHAILAAALGIGTDARTVLLLMSLALHPQRPRVLSNRPPQRRERPRSKQRQTQRLQQRRRRRLMPKTRNGVQVPQSPLAASTEFCSATQRLRRGGPLPLPLPPSDPEFIVGKNEILEKEILIWLFLLHKHLDFWVLDLPS